MRKISLLLFLGLIACSGSGSNKDVQGIVKSSSPTTLNIPATPTPTITVLGRNVDEFKVEFISTSLGTPVANFIIRNIPTRNPVVFELKHANFDPIISFPFDLATTQVVTLPALEAGTTANIIAQVQMVSGQTVTSSAGMILGQLNSEGAAGGGCSPITTVTIKDKQTSQPVTAVGPFYFDQTSQVVNTGSFSDTQCNYVIANILPGVYKLEFLDATLAKQKETEVVVLPGNLSFGMDVP